MDVVNLLCCICDDCWIGGVCGGIVCMIGMVLWIWCLLFMLLVVCVGFGVLFYILFWIFVLEEWWIRFRKVVWCWWLLMCCCFLVVCRLCCVGCLVLVWLCCYRMMVRWWCSLVRCGDCLGWLILGVLGGVVKWVLDVVGGWLLLCCSLFIWWFCCGCCGLVWNWSGWLVWCVWLVECWCLFFVLCLVWSCYFWLGLVVM